MCLCTSRLKCTVCPHPHRSWSTFAVLCVVGWLREVLLSPAQAWKSGHPLNLHHPCNKNLLSTAAKRQHKSISRKEEYRFPTRACSLIRISHLPFAPSLLTAGLMAVTDIWGFLDANHDIMPVIGIGETVRSLILMPSVVALCSSTETSVSSSWFTCTANCELPAFAFPPACLCRS